MNEIIATVKGGRVEAHVPPDWPEGTQVAIQLLDNDRMQDDEGPMSPEEIARTLAAMDKVEPFDMPAEDAADLDAWERKVRDYSIANVDKGIEDVFR